MFFSACVDKGGKGGIMKSRNTNTRSHNIIEANRNVNTHGLRNENSLTKSQISDCISYARKLGFKNDIAHSDYSNTAFVGNVGNDRFCRFVIGTDAYPKNDAITMNGKLSYKSAIAHEVVEHYEAMKINER